MEETIKVGDFIVIQRQKYTKLHKFSSLDSTVNLGKELIELKEIDGKPFWTTFKMAAKGNIKKRLYSLEVCEQNTPDVKSFVHNLESGSDNRNIMDDGSSQTATKEEIDQLRYIKGTGSKEILEHLVENSKTFNSKTEYSQEKYLKKKEKKYFEYIQIRKPTVRLISEIFYRQDPEKVMGIRPDTLSQILTYGNISSTGNYLLYDSGSNGLLEAALMNSIGRGTEGKLLHLHPGNFAQKQGLAALNLNEKELNRCISVNIYSVLRQFHQRNKVDETILDGEEPPAKKLKVENGDSEEKSEIVEVEPKKKPKWFFENEKACALLDLKLDALIIAAKEHPKSILDNLLPFVKPSRPLVIFNQSRELLAGLYVHLKSGNKVTGLRLTSNWMRQYQVLPNRTHPEVIMRANSGFLLCGITVE